MLNWMCLRRDGSTISQKLPLLHAAKLPVLSTTEHGLYGIARTIYEGTHLNWAL